MTERSSDFVIVSPSLVTLFFFFFYATYAIARCGLSTKHTEPSGSTAIVPSHNFGFACATPRLPVRLWRITFSTQATSLTGIVCVLSSCWHGPSMARKPWPSHGHSLPAINSRKNDSQYLPPTFLQICPHPLYALFASQVVSRNQHSSHSNFSSCKASSRIIFTAGPLCRGISSP